MMKKPHPPSREYKNVLGDEVNSEILINPIATDVPDLHIPTPLGIGPGSWQGSPSWATLNYVFRQNATGKLAIGCAGHALNYIGEEVGIVWPSKIPFIKPLFHDLPVFRIGKSIFIIDEGIGNDFGLVEIYPNLYEYVRPEISVIDGPCGTTESWKINQTLHYGHGMAIGTGGTARAGSEPPMCEPLIHRFIQCNTPDAFVTHHPIYFGDSGSPIRNVKGEALGIITHVTTILGEVPIPTTYGTTISKIIRLLDSKFPHPYNWELVMSRNCLN